MTPANMVAGAWTREQETIRAALRDYAGLYGDDFTSAAFNPATAKWTDRPELIERYYLGNTARGGAPWPSLNTIRKTFGTFNAARESIGLEANRPGPRSKRAAGKHAPIRDVRERRVGPEFDTGARAAKAAPVVRTVVDDAEVKRLGKALAKAERALARETTKSMKAAERLHDARGRARTSASELRRKSEALAAAAAREDGLRAELAVRVADARSGVADRNRAERALAAAHATIEALASEHATEVARLAAALETAERGAELVELADPVELERVRTEVYEARDRVAVAVAAQRAAEEAMVAARRERQVAVAARQVAEREALAESTRRVAIQQAVTGHDRPLTADEVEQLRGRGPAGAPVFAAAVKAVARANATGAREPLRKALREVAAAALRWSERL